MDDLGASILGILHVVTKTHFFIPFPSLDTEQFPLDISTKAWRSPEYGQEGPEMDPGLTFKSEMICTMICTMESLFILPFSNLWTPKEKNIGPKLKYGLDIVT